MKTRSAIAALTLLLAASAGLAQTVYRQVDKNGRVSFSDQPPATSNPVAAPQAGNAAAASQALPYELRQATQRYPVTLFTNEECGPCGAARSLLITRGVPFSERTVQSDEDIAALQSLSGQNTVPLLAIGAQHLKGFSDAQWSQYLDAAGYPKSSQLPPGYRNPPAQPLVAAAAPPSAPAASRRTPATAPPPPPAAQSDATPGNPAGIKF